MMSIRPVRRILESKPTMEGAGVKLRRAFGFGDTSEFDPFLLFDDFRNDHPQDYRAGFPWHPHRGHRDHHLRVGGGGEPRRQLGKQGKARRWRRAVDDRRQRHPSSGDVAGRSPGQDARLPALGQSPLIAQDDRAALPGRSSDIPEVVDDDGTRVRVVCGDFWGQRGPVDGIAADPRYLDVWVPAGRRKTLPVENYRHAFAYVFEGSGTFRDASKPFGVLTEKGTPDNGLVIREQTGNRSLVVFDGGDEVTVQAGEDGIRFLLISGQPLEEPVAWYGPIVMNTQAELEQAVSELRNGTFIKHR
jgi:redox-sensitive bicupin YhaK (pirin superfamily)